MSEQANNTAAASKLAGELIDIAHSVDSRESRLQRVDAALSPILSALTEARRELAGEGADVATYPEGTRKWVRSVQLRDEIHAKLDAAIALLAPGEGKGGE